MKKIHGIKRDVVESKSGVMYRDGKFHEMSVHDIGKHFDMRPKKRNRQPLGAFLCRLETLSCGHTKLTKNQYGMPPIAKGRMCIECLPIVAYCTDPRHSKPCPQYEGIPCNECMEECNTDYLIPASSKKESTDGPDGSTGGTTTPAE